MPHVDRDVLDASVANIRNAPKDDGTVELIVRRPAEGEREARDEAQLDVAEGLVGDNWHSRGSKATEDGSAHPDCQVTVMNARAAAVIAQSRERWPLAGDQLYIDLDLSEENLPAGTRLAVGGAIVEVTAQPHTGCGKFAKRFGVEALKFVNSKIGRELNVRGRNVRVVTAGQIRTGDAVHKLG